MRWSLFSLAALLAVLIAGVAARPTPYGGPVTRSRAKAMANLPGSSRITRSMTRAKPPMGSSATRPTVAKKAILHSSKGAPRPIAAKKTKSSLQKALTTKSSSQKASTYKHPSPKYRKTALNSGNHMYPMESGKITKSSPPKKMPKGLDADHIFEAQTVAKAVAKAKVSLAPQLEKDITDRVNSESNLAFVHPPTNRAKGILNTAVLSGKTPPRDHNVAVYLGHTKDAGRAAATDVDKLFKAEGFLNVNVLKEHNDFLESQGVKRREYSDVGLD